MVTSHLVVDTVLGTVVLGDVGVVTGGVDTDGGPVGVVVTTVEKISPQIKTHPKDSL